MTNDLSKRARRWAAATCHTINLTIETSLPTWIQSWNDPQQIEADQHCHQQRKWLPYKTSTMQMRWGGNSVHVNMVATSTAWSNLSLTIKMNTSMLWPMTLVYSHFSGCETVGCSAKGKQHLCQQWSNGEALVTSAWGVWGRWNGY